jgi:hypothetical protein
MEQQPKLQSCRCRKCGKVTRYTVILPMPIDEYVEVMRRIRCVHCGARSRHLTIGEARTMAEDALTRQSWSSERIRAANWILQGEIGLSSLSIHAHMTGDADFAAHQPPRDLDDMRRCILLMHHVPEWLERIPEMRDLPGWDRIAPAFATIQASHLAESPNLDGPAPATARLFQEAAA